MNTKEFLKIGDYSITSDARDIMLPYNKIGEVLNWCDQNNVQHDIPGVVTVNNFLHGYGFHLWRIKDDEQRVLFMLRWS